MNSPEPTIQNFLQLHDACGLGVSHLNDIWKVFAQATDSGKQAFCKTLNDALYPVARISRAFLRDYDCLVAEIDTGASERSSEASKRPEQWVDLLAPLPPLDTPVLALINGTDLCVAMRTERLVGPGWMGRISHAVDHLNDPEGIGEYTEHPITHWMPLPALPPRSQS